MKIETVNTIILNESNELILKIIGNGDPSYQYVYRDAAGVYWDESQKAFKSKPLREWTISDSYLHIKDIVKNSLNVDLQIASNVTWKNISISEQNKIVNALQQSL
ncbi:MAG: hypothetical protein COA32_17515 [Fluviicola sp.]|nr:MAG: hypothetical protein COA32_17515 [Fluviicola sp.]